MADVLEVWASSGSSLVALDGERLSIGKAVDNDICVPDGTVSRMHAVLERYPAGWCVKDLGSRNGTFVNGERVIAERALRPGDEIRVGATRLLFRSIGTRNDTVTEAAESPPELTRREREVLVALCTPLLSADLFTEPASTAEVAGKLFVTEAAVKQHLGNLYAKFKIAEGERRRVKLANEAIRRGAVSIADLRGV